MNEQKIESEATLPPNIDKEKESHPDWRGSISFGDVTYKAAVWYKKISKGDNEGKPFVSLQLENGSLKIDVPLWPNLNRISESDPVFGGAETVQGQKFSFSAWPESLGGSHELKLRGSIYGVDGSNLSPVAQRVHREIAQYLKQAALTLPDDGQTASSPANSALPAKERDPDLDADSDNIPF